MANSVPVGLTTIPNELLDAIVARLNRSSRYALALTCKATNSSATAALYKRYINHTAPSEAPFSLFLRTICEKPQLALLTKELDIRGWRSEFEVATGAVWRGTTIRRTEDDQNSTRTGPRFTSTAKASRTSADLSGLFLETATRIGLVPTPTPTHLIPALKTDAQLGTTLKTDADLIRQLKHGVEDAHFVLLVAQLPRLEWLLVDGLTPYPTLDWHHFLSRSSSALRALKGLNLLGSHITNDYKVVKNTLQVLNILPNLEHLQLTNMSVQGHRHTADDALPTTKLRHVCFQQCAVRHRLLKRIVAGQHLSSFLYIPGYMQLEVNQGAAFSDDQITTYLDSSEHSLKGLVLHSTLGGGHPYIGKFDGLELLDVSYMTLVDNHESAEGHGIIERSLTHKLPSSLKKLVIDQLICEFDMLFIAKEIAHLKIQGDLPNLEVVVLMIAGPHTMLMMGYPPWELCEMRAYIEDVVGEVFEEAKLGLAFGISR